MVYTEKAHHASSSWERNKPESHGRGSSSQLPVCRKDGTRFPPRTQMGNWGGVWRGCEAMFAGLGLFLPPLHFLLMTQQLLVLVQPWCREVIRGKEPGLRVRCCRWLSQRRVLRSARWLLRSCPALGLVRCNRQIWLTSLQEAVAGFGCGDSGCAGSGHRGGGAAPSPYVGRRSRSIERYCSRCRSRWLCGHSSSSSARHRYRLVAWILWGRLVITRHLPCRRGGMYCTHLCLS